MSLAFFSLLVVLSLASLSTGATVSATIDDTCGDSRTGAMPVYVGAFSSGTDCDGLVRPDPTQAFEGTWHASGSASSVTLSFTGTGIDVFCILSNAIPTDLSFTLDGIAYPPFSHAPDSCASDFMYGDEGRVFSIDGLHQVAHRLVIAPNPPAGSNRTMFVFDHATYRFDDEATPSVDFTMIPPQISLASASFSDAASTSALSFTASSISPSSPSSTSALGSTRSPTAPSKHVQVLLATLPPVFLLLLASCGGGIALFVLRRRRSHRYSSSQHGPGFYDFEHYDDDAERQSRWRLRWGSGRRKLSSITLGRVARAQRESRWADVSPYPMYPYQQTERASASTVNAPLPSVWRSTVLPAARFSGMDADGDTQRNWSRPLPPRPLDV